MSDHPLSPPPLSKRLSWDLFALVLPFFGLLPLLLLQVQQLISKQFGMLFPVAWLALLGFVLASKRSIAPQGPRTWLSVVFLGMAALSAIASVSLFSPWLAQLAFGFCFLGWGLIRLYPGSIARVFALSSLIFATLPLPGTLEAWTERLEAFSLTKVASPLLDMFKVYHLFEGSDLRLRDHTFPLAELLSHPISVQAMVLLSLILAIFWRRSLVAGLLSGLSAILWAWVGKLAFLMAAAVLSQNQVDILSPYRWGMTLSLVALGVIVCILISDAFWNAFFQPIRVGEEATIFRSTSANLFNRLVDWPATMVEGWEAEPETQWSVPLWAAIPVGGLLLLLAIPTTLAIARNDLLLNRTNYVSVTRERLPVAESIPDDFLLGQTLRSYRAPSGLTSNTGGRWFWNFSGTGIGTQITTFFPVRGWQDASLLMQSPTGWENQATTLRNDASGWPYSETSLKGKEGISAIVWSAQIHLADGKYYLPTEEELNSVQSLANNPPSRSFFRIVDLINPKQETLRPQCFVVSMAYRVEGELRDAEKSRMLAKFFEARQLLADRFTAGLGQAGPLALPANGN
jgi:hypothetical protein